MEDYVLPNEDKIVAAVAPGARRPQHSQSLESWRETVPARIEPVPIGRAAVLRPGRDVTVVALSRLVSEALLAAEQLAGEGVEVEVTDPRTLVPLDLDTIVASVRRTSRLVVAHEAVRHGGFGAEITASVQRLAFDHLDAPVERVGTPFPPIPPHPVVGGRVPARSGGGTRHRTEHPGAPGGQR